MSTRKLRGMFSSEVINSICGKKCFFNPKNMFVDVNIWMIHLNMNI